MSEAVVPQRCRLVLIAPIGATADVFLDSLKAAIAGGDIASLILPPHPGGEAQAQSFAQAVVPVAQAAGIAAIIAEDTRIAGRVGADGVHIAGQTALGETLERWRDRLIVGTGGATTRDEALSLGEVQPDYMFFGRFGYDTQPEPHRRNLALGRWWAEMIQIPCIVLGGSSVGSVTEVAATGAEFVALSAAVFGSGVDPRDAVAEANALLDPVTADAG